MELNKEELNELKEALYLRKKWLLTHAQADMLKELERPDVFKATATLKLCSECVAFTEALEAKVKEELIVISGVREALSSHGTTPVV